MRNGGRDLLAVLHFYERIKIVWRHSTLIIPSLIACIQSMAASIQKLPDSVLKSLSRDRHREDRCVRRNNQVIDQLEVSR
jgi:hypothetical protein